MKNGLTQEQLAEKIDSILTDYTPFRGNGATDDAVGGIHEQKEAREVKLGQYGHSNQPSHHILYMYIPLFQSANRNLKIVNNNI